MPRESHSSVVTRPVLGEAAVLAIPRDIYTNGGTPAVASDEPEARCGVGLPTSGLILGMPPLWTVKWAAMTESLRGATLAASC
jgi:hypothetical protein